MSYLGVSRDSRPRFRCGCLMRPLEYGSTAELCVECAEQRKEDARRTAPLDMAIPEVSTGRVIRFTIPQHLRPDRRKKRR